MLTARSKLKAEGRPANRRLHGTGGQNAGLRDPPTMLTARSQSQPEDMLVDRRLHIERLSMGLRNRPAMLIAQPDS
jgi:hypothetical protein